MKITKATIKKFVRDHRATDDLYINCRQSFDSMTDGLSTECRRGIQKARDAGHVEYTLGVEGVWILDARNYFEPVEREGFVGYEVSNCCGTFELLTPKK